MIPVAHSIPVNLSSRGYEVFVGVDFDASLRGFLAGRKSGGRCAVVSDETVAALYGDRILQSLRAAGCEPVSIVVAAGEKSKSLGVVGTVCDRMIEAGLDRSSFVVALGGGVVGDLAGFCAAIYYRGIPCLQVPTTVVSQVDSSIGGKTGVNAPGGKNLIGCFHQPMAVIADVTTLRTLPPREYNEGMAEVIKHAIIRDAAMLDALQPSNDEELAALIARNVAIKAAIVSADEFETKGLRALLNFGHTIGHGIENAAGYGVYLHGEAISLGLVAACRLSMQHAGFSAEENQRVLAALRLFQLPETLPAEITTTAIMSALKTDKKFAGQVRFILTPRLGEAFVSREITLTQIEDAVESLRG
ncbi:MAG: 3-dehydroquinate synthase [Chthoniobacteraceae bacterium]